MADSKITALTAISTVDPAADPLVIVDVSDTSMAASGTTKKATINQLLGASGTATLASATISGDLTVDTSTLKVDSANNRVGIKQASPSHPFQIGTTDLILDATGNVGIGVTPAGTGGCLQLKSGITFPATQVASSDANTLDDYEEGTFTPTLTFGGASVGVVYVNRIGIYTKVGRIVHFSGRIDLSSKGSSTGDALITGLPFIGNTGAASVGYQNLTAPSDKQLMLTIDGTVLFPRYASGTTTVQSTDSDFGNSTIIIFAGTFAV